MGFDANEAVPVLEWNFEKYGAGSGVSPEPSDEMVERFKRKQTRLANALIEQLKLVGSAESSTLAQTPAVAQLPANAELLLESAFEEIAKTEGVNALATKASHQMAVMTAEVLSNQPTVEQIEALPHRVRTAFYGWISGQLLRPELYAVGSN